MNEIEIGKMVRVDAPGDDKPRKDGGSHVVDLTVAALDNGTSGAGNSNASDRDAADEDLAIPAYDPDGFAQTSVESSGHHCQFAQERNKADLIDFWGIYNGSPATPYNDTDFSADTSALWWADLGEQQ